MQAFAKLSKSSFSLRSLHSSASVAFPRHPKQVGIPAPPILAKTGQFLDEDEFIDEGVPFEERGGHGSSSMGHLLLRQQRHMLKYMRLIEHDMPKLVQFREEFNCPPNAHALVVRTVDYGGEEHPVTSKRVVVAPIDRLPLKNAKAVHTFKLLAGPRWSLHPPVDSGIGPEEKGASNGYIKIACEDYSDPGMNLKWISDTLDKLVDAANDAKNHAKFSSMPLDMRHLNKGRKTTLPGVTDFPSHWLPQRSA